MAVMLYLTNERNTVLQVFLNGFLQPPISARNNLRSYELYMSTTVSCHGRLRRDKALLNRHSEAAGIISLDMIS